MRIRSFMMVLLLALAHPQTPGVAQPKPQPFSLTLQAPRTAVPTNARFAVKVRLMNISEKDIVVLQCGFTDYTVGVKSIGEATVSQTDLGRQLNQRSLGRVCMSTRTVLKPNESVNDEIAIDELYRVDSPGQYVIRVRRDIPSWLGSKGTVESNSVTITVTPQNTQP
jgi:hypothetical protein